MMEWLMTLWGRTSSTPPVQMVLPTEGRPPVTQEQSLEVIETKLPMSEEMADVSPLQWRYNSPVPLSGHAYEGGRAAAMMRLNRRRQAQLQNAPTSPSPGPKSISRPEYGTGGTEGTVEPLSPPNPYDGGKESHIDKAKVSLSPRTITDSDSSQPTWRAYASYKHIPAARKPKRISAQDEYNLRRERGWDSSHRRYVPSHLRGLKPLTTEPWAKDAIRYESDWDSALIDNTSQGQHEAYVRLQQQWEEADLDSQFRLKQMGLLDRQQRYQAVAAEATRRANERLYRRSPDFYSTLLDTSLEYQQDATTRRQDRLAIKDALQGLTLPGEYFGQNKDLALARQGIVRG